jgi:hypothetical protein
MGRQWKIAPILGAAAIPAGIALDAFQGGMNAQEAMGKLAAAYIGYNPVNKSYQWDVATANYMAIAIGIIVSIVASKAGVNRYLPKGVNL